MLFKNIQIGREGHLTQPLTVTHSSAELSDSSTLEFRHCHRRLFWRTSSPTTTKLIGKSTIFHRICRTTILLCDTAAIFTTLRGFGKGENKRLIDTLPPYRLSRLDKPQSWEKFTDPSLVPERSSLKHQRYDLLSILDDGERMVEVERWNGARGGKWMKSKGQEEGWDGNRSRNECWYDYCVTGWATREEEDTKGKSKEENHIYPPIRQRHPYRRKEKGKSPTYTTHTGPAAS